MQAGRQAGGLAGRQPLTFEMLRCIVLDGPQSKLFSEKNGVIDSDCVWWRVAVLMSLREGLQALLQNTPDMPLRRQPLMFAMLQYIVLHGAAEHATLLESLAHQLKCGAVESKSLAHVVSVLTRAHCLFLFELSHSCSVAFKYQAVLGCHIAGFPIVKLSLGT